MAITAAQYQSMRLAFRIMLSVESAGPTDSDVLAFSRQLFNDSSGATALSTGRNFIATEVLRTVLTAAVSPSDSDVSDFFTQLSTDSGTATPMGLTGRYRSMRNALRAAMSGGGLNPSESDVLSYFAPYGTIPNSFWDQGVWDIRLLSGNPSDYTPYNIASPVSANTLLSNGGPTLDDYAIGGRRTAALSSATKAFYRVDALAARMTAGNTWTRVVRFRVQNAGTQTLFAAGHSTTATNDYLKIQQIANVITITSASTGAGVITRVGTLNLQFDEHVLVVWSDGTTIFVSIDGVAEAITNAAMDPNAVTFDRFGVGAYISTAPTEMMDGYIQFFAASTQSFSAANALILNNQLRGGDFILQKSASAQYMDVGDSIKETSVGTTFGAGTREYRLQWVVDCGISLHSVGLRNLGTMPDRLNEAQGGATLANMQTNAHAALTTVGIAPSAILLMGGTNDIGSGVTATWMAAYRATLNGVYSDAVVKQPSVWIYGTKIPPFQPGTAPNDTNQPLFNAGLSAAGTGEWDVFDAAHPGVLKRGDANAAIGAWSPTTYGANNTHPNEVGCQLIGAAEIIDIGLPLRALSPTINALGCIITSPAPGTVLTQGVAYTFTVQVSRYPSTVVLKQGAATLGSFTMAKKSGTFVYTPGAPDVGAQSFTAVITDTLDGTTATSAPVALTVVAVAPTSAKTIWGAALIGWSRTDLAASAAALPDLSGAGNNYTGTCSINPANAGLNGLRTVAINGLDQKLNSALALPLPGTTPTTMIVVARIPAFTVANAFVSDSAGGGQRLVTLDSGDVFFNDGSSVILAHTYNQWQVYRGEFANTAGDVFSAGTHTTTGNAGNGASAAGRQLGAPGTGFVQEYFEVIYLNRKPTAPELTAYYALLDTLTGSAVTHL